MIKNKIIALFFFSFFFSYSQDKDSLKVYTKLEFSDKEYFLQNNPNDSNQISLKSYKQNCAGEYGCNKDVLLDKGNYQIVKGGTFIQFTYNDKNQFEGILNYKFVIKNQIKNYEYFFKEGFVHECKSFNETGKIDYVVKIKYEKDKVIIEKINSNGEKEERTEFKDKNVLRKYDKNGNLIDKSEINKVPPQ